MVEGCLIDASRLRGRAQWRSIVVAPEDQIAVGQTESSAFRAETRPRAGWSTGIVSLTATAIQLSAGRTGCHRAASIDGQHWREQASEFALRRFHSVETGPGGGQPRLDVGCGLRLIWNRRFATFASRR